MASYRTKRILELALNNVNVPSDENLFILSSKSSCEPGSPNKENISLEVDIENAEFLYLDDSPFNEPNNDVKAQYIIFANENEPEPSVNNIELNISGQ